MVAALDASVIALVASVTAALVAAAACVAETVVRWATSWTSCSRLKVSCAPPAAVIAWAPMAMAWVTYAVRSAPSSSLADRAGPRAPVVHRSASVVTAGSMIVRSWISTVAPAAS